MTHPIERFDAHWHIVDRRWPLVAKRPRVTGARP